MTSDKERSLLNLLNHVSTSLPGVETVRTSLAGDAAKGIAVLLRQAQINDFEWKRRRGRRIKDMDPRRARYELLDERCHPPVKMWIGNTVSTPTRVPDGRPYTLERTTVSV